MVTAPQPHDVGARTIWLTVNVVTMATQEYRGFETVYEALPQIPIRDLRTWLGEAVSFDQAQLMSGGILQPKMSKKALVRYLQSNDAGAEDILRAMVGRITADRAQVVLTAWGKEQAAGEKRERREELREQIREIKGVPKRQRSWQEEQLAKTRAAASRGGGNAYIGCMMNTGGDRPEASERCTRYDVVNRGGTYHGDSVETYKSIPRDLIRLRAAGPPFPVEWLTGRGALKTEPTFKLWA